MIATIAFMLLVASLLVQIVFLFMGEKRRDRFSHFLQLAAALLLFLVTGLRSGEIGFFALTNTFESLVFFSGFIALILFVYRVRTREKALPFVSFGATIVSIVLIAIASSPNIPKEALPPIPALRSHWLVLHVSFSFIGESFFAFAFAASIYYLAVKDDEKRKAADRAIYTSIGIGYPIFTAGALIFGAIWAQYAWGRYWAWDPKETWALVTWIIYTGYLHTRFVARLRGRVSAILSIVGFCFTMFTFFGVNYLLTGLHSYG
jgi:ABC-type transport system involved in cytochrome c biogenesis permease subunit